tara:strand:+ start:178 stop:1005 length:828 start_codon:yes stop_codon:yes gene_type:complete
MVNDYTKFWQARKGTVLYCNGDSFTWGTGIGNLTVNPREDLAKFEEARKTNVWPGQLSNLLDCDHINDAWAGGSNNRVVRRTKKFIEDIDDCADVRVLIGWSTALRTEYFRPTIETDLYEPYRQQGRTGPFDIEENGTYVQMYPSGLTSPTYVGEVDLAYVKYFYKHRSDADLMVIYLQQIIDLQNFLKERDVKYIFFNTFGIKELYKENVQDRRIYPLIDQIDFDRFMGWPDEDFCVWSYMELGDDQLKDGHLGVASHQHLAVLLKNKLEELYG